VDWIGLAQDREKLESSCECGNEHSGTMKCCETIEFVKNYWALE
jgi:hypothetical protein